MECITITGIAVVLLQRHPERPREWAPVATWGHCLKALEQLESYANRIPVDVDPNQASNYIINPLSAQARGGRGGGLAKMFSTHPPTAQRIAKLQEWRG